MWKLGSKFSFLRRLDLLNTILLWYNFIVFFFDFHANIKIIVSIVLIVFISLREKAVLCGIFINFFINCPLIPKLIKGNIQMWDYSSEFLCPWWASNVPFSCTMSFPTPQVFPGSLCVVFYLSSGDCRSSLCEGFRIFCERFFVFHDFCMSGFEWFRVVFVSKEYFWAAAP